VARERPVVYGRRALEQFGRAGFGFWRKIPSPIVVCASKICPKAAVPYSLYRSECEPAKTQLDLDQLASTHPDTGIMRFSSQFGTFRAAPMGLAPVVYALWQRYLRYGPLIHLRTRPFRLSAAHRCARCPNWPAEPHRSPVSGWC